MPRVCTVCAHADRATIDQALVRGETLAAVAALFRVSADAVARHKASHLPRLLIEARDSAEVTRADGLLGELHDLQRRTLALLDAAEQGGKLYTAVSAIQAARSNIELMAKLTHELDERPVLNLLVAPEWLALRGQLLAALAPYPEARLALVEALDAG